MYRVHSAVRFPVSTREVPGSSLICGAYFPDIIFVAWMRRFVLNGNHRLFKNLEIFPEKNSISNNNFTRDSAFVFVIL